MTPKQMLQENKRQLLQGNKRLWLLMSGSPGISKMDVLYYSNHDDEFIEYAGDQDIYYNLLHECFACEYMRTPYGVGCQDGHPCILDWGAHGKCGYHCEAPGSPYAEWNNIRHKLRNTSYIQGKDSIEYKELAIKWRNVCVRIANRGINPYHDDY